MAFISSTYPFASTSPSGCIISCNGFRCIAKASVFSISIAFGAYSTCGAPIFPIIKAWGALSRTTVNVSVNSGFVIPALWLPTPIPILVFSVAIANFSFIFLLDGCPPVIAEIISGEDNFLPKSSIEVSISS